MLQNPQQLIYLLHLSLYFCEAAHGWKKFSTNEVMGGGEVSKGVGGKLLRGRHQKINTPVHHCLERNGDYIEK
jgi:hypothetical protein